MAVAEPDIQAKTRVNNTEKYNPQGGFQAFHIN
jgi:hypothetical protein